MSDPQAVPAKPSLIARVLLAFPAVLIALLAAYALNRSGALRGLEHMILDTEMRLRESPPSPVAFVTITDADYASMFEGRSPLNVTELRELISDIAFSEPLVIGVDIDTSHTQFQGLTLDPDWPRVVWERDVYSPQNGGAGEFEPLDVLGGQDPQLNRNAGIPALLEDPEDKVTRGYTHCIETKAGLVPSFSTVVIAASRAAQQKLTADNPLKIDCEGDVLATAPMLIHFSTPNQNSRQVFTAAEVRKISGPVEKGGQEKEISELCNKIVLLGGSYGDWDRHDTPLGRLVGVEVLANVVETQWDGDPIRVAAPWVLFLLDFLAASLLLILLHLFPTTIKRQLILGFCVAAFISLILSVVTFRTASRLAAFAPTLIAVILFEVYVHVREQFVLRAVNLGHSAGSQK